MDFMHAIEPWGIAGGMYIFGGIMITYYLLSISLMLAFVLRIKMNNGGCLRCTQVQMIIK